MKKLTINKLYNTNFPDLYEKLILNEELSDIDITKIVSLACFFINLEDDIIKLLGYRLILLYTKRRNDYSILYEFSVNKGLIPISQFIFHKLSYAKYSNLQTEINDILSKNFKVDNTYRTMDQIMLIRNVKENMNYSQVIIAPTSYGKTELIMSIIQNNMNKNICILTSTKSLLTQTKKRVLNSVKNKKIIIYPEMYYESNENVIAILTQERLIRLLQLHKNIKFDILIVDEAHNLLDNKSHRSILLSIAIILCYHRNKSLICKYFTPFIKSKESIRLKYVDIDFKEYIVNEIIKTENFYVYDVENKVKKFFDQFSPKKNKFIDMHYNDKYNSDVKIVLNECSSKNIVYLNKPKSVEEFAQELFVNLEVNFVNNEEILKAINDIKDYVHPEYRVAKFLSKGIIYHHGCIPEQIRYFIEELYSNIKELNILVTTSTLLEGVNIPATKMFILDPRKGKSIFSHSSFKNLIGRVCRLSEIFNKDIGNLDYLMPEICIIKGKYFPKNFTIENFFGKCEVSLLKNNTKDKIDNPLLVNYEGDENEIVQANEKLENLTDDNIIKNYSGKRPKTIIGEYCYQNNINIFDIVKVEKELEMQVFLIIKIDNIDYLFCCMHRLFFSKIEDDFKDDNIKRLKNLSAINFYKMLIKWRMRGLKMKDMISNMLKYWERVEEKLVYVGNSWGDKTRNGIKKLWTKIDEKTYEEKVNLAIVRLNEEYNFIDNELIKYVEVLNSIGLLDEELYLEFKYGTKNRYRIALINSGISSYLADLLNTKYKDLYSIDNKGNVKFDKSLILKMRENDENGILVLEVKLNSDSH